MKELSIEEKALAYDEIVARAKKYLEDCPDRVDARGCIEHLIPELKESEDEKIINNIKKVIGWYRGTFTEKSLMPEEYQEINAWLEKQGEQKPILDVEIPFGAKDSELEEVSYNVPNGYHAEIEDNKVVIKKGGQKPAWSEEDERHLNSIIKRTIAYGDSSVYGLIKDDIDWLKSVKERYTWKPSDEQMLAISTAINVLGKGTLNGKQLIELQEQLKAL